jgi:type IV pilus assembly protein PilB
MSVSEFIQKKRIGEILISKGLITQRQLEDALELQQENRKRVGEIWVEAGILSEEILARALATQYSVPYFDMSSYTPKDELLALVADTLVTQYRVLPVRLLGNMLTLVTADPTNVMAFQNVARFTGYQVEFVVAQEGQLNQHIDAVMGGGEAQTLADVEVDHIVDEVNLEIASDEDENEAMDGYALDNLKKESQDSAIIQLVNKIILQAIQERCTDIHFECQPKDVLVRYRIDGDCYDRMRIPGKAANAVISRVKILCDVDITERTIPQDGGFKVKLKGKNIDFRVSILPCIYGQNIVIRILGAGGVELDLDELGIDPQALDRWKAGIFQPYGWALVTGPTGSGKTTTLYSSLATLNNRETKIITVEDPVEYKLPGIHQTQIRINKADPERSLTFAKALRSILRQDPDIVMIGEIRDYETAEIAIQAALTGHLVFATLHANTSIDTIGRLQNIGIDNFLFAAALNVVVAQRLVRRVCTECKEQVRATKDELIAAQMDYDKYADYPFFRGKGCNYCNQTGNRGRAAIFEVFLLSDEVRQMIIDNVSMIQIRDQALKEGMMTLYDSALKKVLSGDSSTTDLAKLAGGGH